MFLQFRGKFQKFQKFPLTANQKKYWSGAQLKIGNYMERIQKVNNGQQAPNQGPATEATSRPGPKIVLS
jgi:hypothetical protein